MTFSFGGRSIQNLRGVHFDLCKVADRALEITPIDFTVTCGVRTKEQQAALLAKGATKTMDSRHLTGHAIDVAPNIGGQYMWDWPLFFQLAEAFRSAALELEVHVVWGGIWDRSLLDIPAVQTMEDAHEEYIERRRKLTGKAKVFVDGPHFELSRKHYS